MDPNEPSRVVKISKGLKKELAQQFAEFLSHNQDVFAWTHAEKCEQAFLALKEYLGCLSLLSKPKDREKLYLYLVVSEEAISTALVREEEKS